MDRSFQKTITLENGHLSTLFTALHDVAALHQNQDVSEEELHRRGVVWIVVRQRMEFAEDFCCHPGERVIVTTALGECRFGLIPRNYSVHRMDGTLLCRATAEWTLMDSVHRTMAQPQDFGIDLTVTDETLEGVHLSMLRPAKGEAFFNLEVLPEYLDSNGHMNNARYFDAVQKCLPVKNRKLVAAQVSYHAESLLGDVLTVHYQWTEQELLLEGRMDKTLRFRMMLLFAEE